MRVLLLALLLTVPLLAQTLPPRDTTAEAPGFADFKQQMERALAERDSAFFKERAQGAKLSFGPDTTLDKAFKLEDPNDEFWFTMERILGMGGVYQDGVVIYPYVFALFPGDKDAFTHLVITGNHVNLRSRPSVNSKVVGQLDYDIVKRVNDGVEWTEVETLAGRRGFVANDFVYSPIGYRLGLAQKDGRWQIQFFLAGD